MAWEPTYPRYYWKPAFDQLVQTVSDVHKWADTTINQLEGNPILEADTAEGDEARAALDNARKWRARIEGDF